MNNNYDDYSGYRPMLSSSMEIGLYRNKDMREIEPKFYDFFEMFFLVSGNVTFDPLIRHRIRTMLFELHRETKAKEFGKDIMVESELKTLLILLNRFQSAHIRSEDSGEQESRKNISEILKYINHHYTDNLTLDQLCETFYISKFYLSRSFEHLTHKSIYQYIQEKRMTMARQLLLSGERPTDIYKICGFSSYSNFYRAFRKYFGTSPREFISRITGTD